MKKTSILRFDLDDEVDAEKFRCAQKGYKMSGMLDSFLDYLAILAPTIDENKNAQQLFDEIFEMYRAKLIQADLVDMVEEDVRYLIVPENDEG